MSGRSRPWSRASASCGRAGIALRWTITRHRSAMRACWNLPISSSWRSLIRLPASWRRLVAELKPRGVQLIAENVETPEDFEACVALGFTGFQGYFLQHPQTFRAKRVPSSRLSTLRLVTSLSNEQYSIDEIELLISQNVSMSYHVLRCINSSYYNLARKIDSIRQAIVILGVDHLRQLCSLLCLQGFDDRPPSLFLNAMTRARMCEQLGRMGGAKDTGAFFITGLFSLLNAMTGMPTQKIVEELPLSPAVSRALVAGEGDLGKALKCTRAYERAAWDQVSYGNLAPSLIRAAYVDALFWPSRPAACSRNSRRARPASCSGTQGLQRRLIDNRAGCEPAGSGYQHRASKQTLHADPPIKRIVQLQHPRVDEVGSDRGTGRSKQS